MGMEPVVAHADAEADRHPVQDERDDEVSPAEGEDSKERHHVKITRTLVVTGLTPCLYCCSAFSRYRLDTIRASK